MAVAHNVRPRGVVHQARHRHQALLHVPASKSHLRSAQDFMQHHSLRTLQSNSVREQKVRCTLG